MNTPMLNIRGPALAEALTLVRAGEGLTAAFDFGGQFSATETGTRAEGLGRGHA